MDELEFYNQQFANFGQYDHQREANSQLDLTNPEDYFEYLVGHYSHPNATLVDLGCGDGFFTAKFAHKNKAVIGVEPSKLIEAAYRQITQSNQSSLNFIAEKAEQLSLEDQSVDLVISRRGPDPSAEIARILKPGGIFLFITIGEKDCLALKQQVGRGQHYGRTMKVTQSLSEKFKASQFSIVQCDDFLYSDEFESPSALISFLHQVPVFDQFSEQDYPAVKRYCQTAGAMADQAAVILGRHRVVLVAKREP